MDYARYETLSITRRGPGDAVLDIQMKAANGKLPTAGHDGQKSRKIRSDDIERNLECDLRFCERTGIETGRGQDRARGTGPSGDRANGLDSDSKPGTQLVCLPGHRGKRPRRLVRCQPFGNLVRIIRRFNQVCDENAVHLPLGLINTGQMI